MSAFFDLPVEYEYDLKKWSNLFPLKSMSTEEQTRVGSAGIISLYEQIRSKYLYPAHLDTVAVDKMLFGYGEPLRRDVTKVGGLPYRPKGMQWPKQDNREMTFLVQYRFRESRELLGRALGDMLLVFARDGDFADYQDPSFFHFEWHGLGIAEVVTQDEVPDPAWTFVKCFGVRHRSVDFTNLDKCRDILRPTLPKYMPDLSERRIDERIRFISCFAGMKIGGVPFWEPEILDERKRVGQSFLCSLADISPSYTSADRWINQREAQSGPPGPEEVLEWMDGFELDFFLDETGKVVPHLHGTE